MSESTAQKSPPAATQPLEVVLETIVRSTEIDVNAHVNNAKYVEYLTPAAYIDELLTTPFQLDDHGELTVPDAPGLGIELDRDSLKRFAG